MKVNYKDYLLDVQTENIEEMERLAHMMTTRLESILSDVQYYLNGSRHGDFNGIDIMCGNVASELVRIAKDAGKIRELRTQNSTISMAMMEEDKDEN